MESQSGDMSINLKLSENHYNPEPFHLKNPIMKMKHISSTGSKGVAHRFSNILRSRSFNDSSESSEEFENSIKGRHNSYMGKADHSDSNRSVFSVANSTICSYETVKVSNLKNSQPNHSNESTKSGAGSGTCNKADSKKRWKKLKNVLGIKKTTIHPDDNDALNHHYRCKLVDAGDVSIPRQRAQTEDSRHILRQKQPTDKNTTTFKTPANDNRNNNSKYLRKQTASFHDCVFSDRNKVHDDVICHRYDGIDILYLGDGRFTSMTATTTDAPWDLPFLHTFTGDKPHWSAQRIVLEMLLSSSKNCNTPEIILDGMNPGPNGRWCVQIDVPRQHLFNQMDDNKKIIRQINYGPGLQSSHNSALDLCKASFDDGDNDCADISITKLQNMLWGTMSPPPNFLDSKDSSDENPLHSLATRCSIPIDIDDDTFIISTREHVQSLHDIISMQLTKGRFDDACYVFYKLLQGIKANNDPQLRIIYGATLHNIGVIQMWHDKTNRKIISTFQQAINIRQDILSCTHEDVVVSLVKKATALFREGTLTAAVSTLEKALQIVPQHHLIYAKLLNNLGVAYYFYKGGKTALKEFIKAHTIQRHWLEETRAYMREKIVYESAVTLCNMGKVYFELLELDMAMQAYEEAILMLTSIFSKYHDMVLACLCSLAMVKSHKGEYRHSLQILNGSLRSQNQRLGELSLSSIETIGLISYVSAKNEKYDDALKYSNIVLKWQQSNLNETHPAFVRTKEAIKMLGKKIKEKNKGIIKERNIASF